MKYINSDVDFFATKSENQDLPESFWQELDAELSDSRNWGIVGYSPAPTPDEKFQFAEDFVRIHRKNQAKEKERTQSSS